jgi:hypothetical protein
MKEYMEWVATEGIKYKTTTGQPNYLVQRRRDDAAKDAAKESESAATDDGAAAVEEKSGRDGKRGGRPGGRNEKNKKPFSTYTPFPLNPYFKSQAVLSEVLKEEIYHAIMGRGRQLRDVSTQYKVSMERVAAVVRMKQMERDWLVEVRFNFFLFLMRKGGARMMKYKYSISLEDNDMVRTYLVLNEPHYTTLSIYTRELTQDTDMLTQDSNRERKLFHTSPTRLQ